MYFYGFDQFDQNIAQKQASNVCKGKREMGVANRWNVIKVEFGALLVLNYCKFRIFWGFHLRVGWGGTWDIHILVPQNKKFYLNISNNYYIETMRQL